MTNTEIIVVFAIGCAVLGIIFAYCTAIVFVEGICERLLEPYVKMTNFHTEHYRELEGKVRELEIKLDERTANRADKKFVEVKE